ncbi:SGNH/GDSL hydrolase family protein [Chitinophaga horti]|uniref:SGNH/GDSL hydrolase family protein n=1 Tax=Chitinophaga horti TaxID=2920382 RepID=A0ABY6IZS5_9BACT|nr:SGNH/GDSL hydrolase family protein [Chitinophaga horti]UYQ91631.1 SGNH/GDSL hydrolase family protein [Chitinophaga horti]
MNFSYLALGDSYTIGEAVPADERFPAKLASLLHIAEPRIVAVTGWTTDELAAGIEAADIQATYDLVTLLIGVNNQYRGRSLPEYREQFTSLLKQAIAFAGHKADHVIVVSIPDWGVTPFAAGRDQQQIAAEIDAFNAANKEIALAHGAQWIDITPFTREATADPALVASDGLHPSGKDYARWAAAIAPLVKR